MRSVAAEALLGRDGELVAIDGLFDQAQSGWSALVVEGEPGIGKTAVWLEGVRRARARGLTVLLCRPTEAEAKLSFAALGDLLEPVSAEPFAVLPVPQRQAIEAALLRDEGGGSRVEPRAVAAGLQRVLVEIATSSPVLVAIDDSHWLDRASAGALEFALRRLDTSRVAALLTRRSTATGRLDVPSARVVALDKLSLAAIHELVKRRLGRSFPRPVLVRLYETCGGNPFFALEIARELFSSRLGPGDSLPLPADLKQLIGRRLGRLSRRTGEALLAASALAEPTRELIAAAIKGDPSVAFEEAEAAELIEFDGATIRFRHPLYAAVIYASTPRERRRRLHRRLSEVVGNLEEQARHLALGSDAPSAELAGVLDEAAARALQRGAPSFAAELTELALARTPTTDGEQRQDRTLEFAERLVLAADAGRAREVLEASLPTLTGPTRRVQALLALSELAMWSSSPDWVSPEDHPVALAERALAAAADDPSLAARVHTTLAAYAESDSGSALRHAARALELIERGADVPARVHADALSVLSRAELFRGCGLDVARVQCAVELERESPAALVGDRSSYKLGQWLKYVDDFDGSRRALEQARREAADIGDDFSLVNILINLIILECWAGRWSDARELGAELVQRFVELGWDGSPIPHVALVAALEGDADVVRELDEMPPWDGIYDVIRLRPLGLLALSQSDFATAARHFTRALQLLDQSGMREPAVFRIHADAIESIVRSGDVDAAARLSEWFSAHAAMSAIPWNRATAARCRAVVDGARGDLESALDEIAIALVEHESSPMPFERGRSLLVKGEFERRAKRKGAARTSLEQALATFAELGAQIWCERAQGELDRVGLRRARDDGLTETERRVAELAASGLTNREVAARMYLSPKTVEANLARVYRKLGIRSRAELGKHFANAGATPTQT
jgi:DNA-binding CsgD family transcriptional regulator